ncbi:MAG: protein-L-isoaspartate O-methyltransferase family protein [Steroidobacteraceae bacterium]
MNRVLQSPSSPRGGRSLITANAEISERGSRLAPAFAGIPRERFLGRGPWKIVTPVGYLDTPNDDPTLLYQDITVALRPERRINNGQPTLHARSISALGISVGETVIHIGAGTGYYTAVLADLAGPTGSVTAFEIEADLAGSAADNLSDRPNIRVVAASGSSASLVGCDVIYVNAGATDPLDAWLDVLKPDGRLLFPLTPTQGLGGMLLVTRRGSNDFAAQFVAHAMFIPWHRCARRGDRKKALGGICAPGPESGEVLAARYASRRDLLDGRTELVALQDLDPVVDRWSRDDDSATGVPVSASCYSGGAGFGPWSCCPIPDSEPAPQRGATAFGKIGPTTRTAAVGRTATVEVCPKQPLWCRGREAR